MNPVTRLARTIKVRDLSLGIFLGLGLLVGPARGEAPPPRFEVFPPQVVLDSSTARHSVLVMRRSAGAASEDLTSRASFRIEDPSIAAISSDGVVTPLANGRASLICQVDGETQRVPITVRGMEQPSRWSFRNHVLPVLTKAGCNSGACHGAAAGKNGFRLTLRGYGPEIDYDVLTRQAHARRIDKTHPSESLMLLKATAAIKHGGGPRIAPGSREFQILADWIASGLEPPSDNDAKLKEVRVFPDSLVLSKGRTQRLLVQASYSDGRVEDVTPWAKFGSTDETVARVGETGSVTVEGEGETAITVWFASLVARATVTSPQTQALEPRAFTDSPKHNRIDELNLAKLEQLRIPPSPQASDEVFLRRASLDCTGTLPTIEQVRGFLEDRDPKKREKLIDRLLGSPEFVDYWSYKWSDLFLVSSRKLGTPAMWAFHRFVREAVQKNTPWDVFARELLTAKGQTLTNGATNYFVLHRDPIELTENTSMAFLGLSMTCARCHNHPMEKWTQDDYYGLANLFTRVSLKDGETAGDVVVSVASEGNLPHPRTGKVLDPRPLDGKGISASASGDRREAFVEWLARPENPYFARSVVNRVWRNFFARGLVEPEDDLRATNPPSDERLMAWLVEDFRAHRFDVQHLIRTIMNSAVYQRSSATIPGNAQDLKFLSHYVPRRLGAEVLLDAISRVTEVPTTFAGYPAGWRSLQLPDSQVDNAFLTAFGRPERLTTCSCERSSEPSMAQALHLANGSTLNDKLRAEKNVIGRSIEQNLQAGKIVEEAFLAALSRRPSDRERAIYLKSMETAGSPGTTKPDGAAAATAAAAKEQAQARRQAVEDVYWALLTSDEFLFNH